MTFPRIGRRTFAIGGAGALLFGCGEDEDPIGPSERVPATQRVAVIGAGIAGLHCALNLAQANVEVQVYEAQTRVGGRLFTARDIFPGSNVAGRGQAICELGAEFIGTLDASMRALARELGIVLEDVSTVPPDFEGRLYVSGGSKLDESELTEELATALEDIVSALQSIGSDRERVDRTSLATWIADKLAKFPTLTAFLPAAFRAEFGLEPDQLSALNLLSLIGDPSDSPAFQLFKRRELRFRAARASAGDAVPGMDQFATKIHEGRLQERVHLDSQLLSVRPHGNTFTLLFERRNGTGFETEAEHVVFAIPFSVLRQVDLSALQLSASKREIIAQLGYGTTAKFAGLFNKRAWREKASTGAVIDDTRQIWDATLSSSQLGVLAVTLGGKAGLTYGAVDAEVTFGELLRDLEPLFPGIKDDYRANSAVRVNWPAAPFARGSASCYRPGQWAQRGTEARREGALHFCGEHCSLDFSGRLEGAAETGALVAAEILEDLDRTPGAYLAELLNLKRRVIQPYGIADDLASENLLRRVQNVAVSHLEFVTALGDPSAG